MTSKVQPAADYWTIDVRLLNHWKRKPGDEVESEMSEMARFRSLSEENIAQLLNDKDSENTKTSTKQRRLIFESYLKEKNIRNPTTAVELAAVLRKFYAEARKKDGQMYAKNSLNWMNNKAIISFCFRRIWRILQISEGVIHRGRRMYGEVTSRKH